MNSSEQLHWFAVQVETTRERRAASAIAAREIECFAPCYAEKRVWSDRVKLVEWPLFPGYVFARCRFSDRITIVKVPAVQKLVSFGELPAPIDEEEILAIRAAVANGLPRRPVPVPKAGQRVRISRGPLKGSRGMLVSCEGGRMFVATITLLQRSVSVGVDPDWIEIDDACPSHLESPPPLVSRKGAYV